MVMFRRLRRVTYQYFVGLILLVFTIITTSIISRLVSYFKIMNDKLNSIHGQLESISERLDKIDINQKTLGIDMVADFRGNTTSNLHNFQYLLNNDTLCSRRSSLTYLIYVHSKPINHDKRQDLRESWAQTDLILGQPSCIVFFLGATTSVSLQQDIIAEFRLHGDLVQEDFIDSYHNLTYKGIAALKWISTFCPNVKHVIKSDDDTFINIFLLSELFSKYAEKRRYIAGLIWSRMRILRSKEKASCFKWCINDKVFPKKVFYPRYCSGAAFLMSSSIIKEMYEVSLHTPFFWVDDVYITGILLLRLKQVEWINEKARFDYNIERFHKHYFSSRHSTSRQPKLMVTSVKSRAEMWESWHIVLQYLTKHQIDMMGKEKYKRLSERALHLMKIS